LDAAGKAAIARPRLGQRLTAISKPGQPQFTINISGEPDQRPTRTVAAGKPRVASIFPPTRALSARQLYRDVAYGALIQPIALHLPRLIFECRESPPEAVHANGEDTAAHPAGNP
jgi:hypothetical protein